VPLATIVDVAGDVVVEGRERRQGGGTMDGDKRIAQGERRRGLVIVAGESVTFMLLGWMAK
jgi:hypothetical protein